jgi:hypothetical protein
VYVRARDVVPRRLALSGTPRGDSRRCAACSSVQTGSTDERIVAQFSITPTYNAGIADRHVAHVFGAAFGYGF